MPRDHGQPELRQYYATLYQAWGAQHWWPAETRFEVIVGAYLTQNAAWTNVERALQNLRGEDALHLEAIRKMRLSRLERLIRPSGYFRQKAARLKTFIAFLDKQYEGSLERMFAEPTEKLREELLGLNGVGPETADSILLYAGNHPVFVVDAYTRRILERHHILPTNADYEDIRELFQRALQPIANELSRAQYELHSSGRGRNSGRRSPAQRDEYGAPHRHYPGLQRNARLDCGGRQAFLWKITAQV